MSAVAKANPELCSPEAPTSSGRFGSIQRRPGITSIPCQPAVEVPNTSTATAKHSLEMPRSRNCSSVGADPEEDSSLTAVPPAISLIGGYQRTPTPVCCFGLPIKRGRTLHPFDESKHRPSWILICLDRRLRARWKADDGERLRSVRRKTRPRMSPRPTYAGRGDALAVGS